MVSDARSNVKHWLDTFLLPANLTEDDNATLASYVVMFADPDYSLNREFGDNDVDLVFAVGKPVSEPLIGHDISIIGYREQVPITTFCVDKTDITGTKLNWKAETEMRRVAETEPHGSQVSFSRMSDKEQKLGSTILYSSEYDLRYRRGIT